MTTEDELVEKKALEHARALGCDCQPEISYTKDGDVLRLQIAHDGDCTLMKEKA